MAAGRTISASFLTSFEEKILDLCIAISKALADSIDDVEDKKKFKNDFGKISKTRDAGASRGGGKLQRDALCTRGIQGKAPFSNRNFRWHPLVVAQTPLSFAKPIERIEIDGDTLNFVVNYDDVEKIFPADKVHEMPTRYVVLPAHWQPHLDILKSWNDVIWTQNSCIITAYEACNWVEAVEAYAILGISVVVNFFNIDFDSIYQKIIFILSQQNIDNTTILPSIKFPFLKEDIVSCPLCKTTTITPPANLPERIRELRWKPEWIDNKRGEGEDGSMQIMHVLPLTEHEIRHNALNVRYGHRWCNVSMTDHSISETIDFMEYIVKAHNRI